MHLLLLVSRNILPLIVLHVRSHLFNFYSKAQKKVTQIVYMYTYHAFKTKC